MQSVWQTMHSGDNYIKGREGKVNHASTNFPCCSSSDTAQYVHCSILVMTVNSNDSTVYYKTSNKCWVSNKRRHGSDGHVLINGKRQSPINFKQNTIKHICKLNTVKSIQCTNKYINLTTLPVLVDDGTRINLNIRYACVLLNIGGIIGNFTSINKYLLSLLVSACFPNRLRA